MAAAEIIGGKSMAIIKAESESSDISAASAAKRHQHGSIISMA